MKLSLILEAVNRISKPLDQGRKSLDQLKGSSQATGRAVGSMDRSLWLAAKRMELSGKSAGGMAHSMNGATRSARALGHAGETMGGRIAAGARRGVHAIATLERRAQLSSATMQKLAIAGAGFLGSTIRGGAIAGGAAVTAGAAGGLYKIISAGTQFELYRTQLEGLENGNAAAAQRSLDWIKDFAAKTPYDMAEVTQAFISARNAGIDPMNGSLMTLGDAASALGKTYDDAIAMLADAKTEQYERLREFGITPSQKGDKVTLKYWDRTGKEMVRTVNKAGNEVERALLEIFEVKFGGGMDRASQTTMGKWRTFTDKIGMAAVGIWEGGFGQEVQRQLDRLTNAFDQAEKDGSLARWSKETSEALRDVVKTIGDADWKGFRDDIKGIAGAFADVYNMASKAAGVLSDIRKWMADKEKQADGVIGGLSWSPKGGLVYNPPPWMMGGATSKPSGVAPFKDAAAKARAGKQYYPRSDGSDIPFFDSMEWQTPYPSRAIGRKDWERAIQGGALSRGVRPPIKAPAPPLKPAKGEVKVQISADPGLRARPTKVAASGMTLEVNTGKAMGGWA